MKKVLALLVAGVLVIGLFACGESHDEKKTSKKSVQEEYKVEQYLANHGNPIELTPEVCYAIRNSTDINDYGNLGVELWIVADKIETQNMGKWSKRLSVDVGAMTYNWVD